MSRKVKSERPAKGVCSQASILPSSIETVCVANQQLIAAKFGESLTQAKIDEYRDEGVEAYPLIVRECSIEVHGSDRTPFFSLNLHTSYDFLKLGSLEVDAVNTQTLDTARLFTHSVNDSKPEFLYATPIILAPANSSSVRLVFTIVLRESCRARQQAGQCMASHELFNWCLTNSNGQQVTFMQSFFCRGGPEQALASYQVQDANGAAATRNQGASRRTAARAARRKTMKQKLAVKASEEEGSIAEGERVEDDFKSTHIPVGAIDLAPSLHEDRGLQPVRSSNQQPLPARGGGYAEYHPPVPPGQFMPTLHQPSAEMDSSPAAASQHNQKAPRKVTPPDVEDMLDGHTMLLNVECMYDPDDWELAAGIATEERWLRNFLAGRMHPELVDSSALAEVELLLAGWLSAMRAAESNDRLLHWDGIRKGVDKSLHYWVYSRCLNASWRLCFLKQQKGLYVIPPPIRLQCAWGRCSGKLCTCHPDPWQPLPALEPVIQPFCNNPLTCESDAAGPGLGYSSMCGVNCDTDWRNLLRGTHAFSLRGAKPVSLYADNTDGAAAARCRLENAGWRRWYWVKNRESGQADLSRSCSTPSSSAPGTPAMGAMRNLLPPPGIHQMQAQVSNALHPAIRGSNLHAASPLAPSLNGHASSALAPSVNVPAVPYYSAVASPPVVLLPIPLPFVASVQRYAEELQRVAEWQKTAPDPAVAELSRTPGSEERNGSKQSRGSTTGLSF